MKLVSKKITALAFVLSTLPMLSQTAMAASSEASFKIKAHLTEKTCDVHAQAEDIDLGGLHEGRFVNGIFKEAAARSVVSLQNCSTGVESVKVKVTYGDNEKTGDDAAAGISALLFHGDTEMEANKPVDATLVTDATDGTKATLKLTPGLKKDAAKFKAGHYESTVHINIEYA